MIFDARSVPLNTVLDADLCIVGGGAAGITIARELAGSSLKVVLLESGGETVDPVTQSLYRGEVVGQHYERLDANRSRFLGGSTNCWGGWCREFDAQDFEARDWMPNSGWPFSRSELEPYYLKAHDIVQLGPRTYDPAYWQERIRDTGLELMPLPDGPVHNVVNQFSPPTRFGEVYGPELKAAANTSVYLFANVTEIESDSEARRVTGVQVATLDGNRFSVRARAVALCSGGLENARLLLASNRTQTAGLGNTHDLVGRYFMDHPRVRSSRFKLKDQRKYRRLYDQSLALARRRLNIAHLRMAVHLGTTAEAQRTQRLANSRTYIVAHYFGQMTAAHDEIFEIREMLRGRRKFGTTWGEIAGRIAKAAPVLLPAAPQVAYGIFDSLYNPDQGNRDFFLETILEPTPNRDSRVTLSDARDRLGMPVLRLDWRLADEDRDHFVRTVGLVRESMEQAGVAVFEESMEEAAARWPSEVNWCWHHMGTTRMHQDPRQGVVDANCRVHGIDNLYVAGSSIYPTPSCDIPTITIVALAVRLSERLRHVLSAAPAMHTAAA